MKEAFSVCVALNNSSQQRRKEKPSVEPETRSGQKLVTPPTSLEDENSPSLCTERQKKCAMLLAEWYLNKGSPVLGACSMLAADHYKGCLELLLRGHELELCVVVGRCLCATAGADSVQPYCDAAVRYLCIRAARLRLTDIITGLVALHSPGLDREVLLVELLLLLNNSDLLPHAARETDANYLLSEAAPPRQVDSVPASDIPKSNKKCFTDPLQDFSTSEAPLNDLQRRMKSLLSDQPETSLKGCLDFVVDELSSGRLYNPDLWRCVRLLQAYTISRSNPSICHNGNLPEDQKVSEEPVKQAEWAGDAALYGSVLTVSAVTGAIKAAVVGYDCVIPQLLVLARLYVERYKPYHTSMLEAFTRSLQSKWEEGGAEAVAGPATQALKALWPDRGLVRVAGSHLPRHSDTLTSCLTKTIIRGPVYRLEHSEAVLGLNEAIMLAKVHPFSPLADSAGLLPF